MSNVFRPRLMEVVRQMMASPGRAHAKTDSPRPTVGQTPQRAVATDKARASPLARTSTKALSKDCTKGDRDEACRPCPPDKGSPLQRNFAVRKPWVDYQARIGGMPNGPTFIVEWVYNSVTFDAFDSGQCLLKEAKAQYDQFFDEWGEFGYSFQKRIFEDMLLQAAMQAEASEPTPPVQLKWFFMEPMSYRHMQIVMSTRTPKIEVLLRP